MNPAPCLTLDPRFQELAARVDSGRRLAAFAAQNLEDARMNLRLAEIANKTAEAAAVQAVADLETYRANFYRGN